MPVINDFHIQGPPGLAVKMGDEHEEIAGDAMPDGTQFKANDRTASSPLIDIPGELWLTVLESPCTFPPECFLDVMLNLIKNPNITSSHLFRADIFYDSGECSDHSPKADALLQQLKQEYRPISQDVPGYVLSKTIVRQLVPRNAQLDKPLVQTCHFYQRCTDEDEQNLVVYIPHVAGADQIPFYHPEVAKLAFTHTWQHSPDNAAAGSISISYSLFPATALTSKLSRTALRLLQTIRKHGQGRLVGYEKRVNHDQLIPQKRYQDTYARLKAKYGRQLSEQWVEVTDPGKHVFEDLGIAAFLIEIWAEMYHMPGERSSSDRAAGCGKTVFPGFVDIGCGNGLLVSILLSEGYTGWGFDARERKTWSTFPSPTRSRLQQRLLVPDILHSPADTTNESWHNGLFTPGTFIISNHADELTPWTPLLAYLNDSSFIAIPCCSHDLSGARFRAPSTTKGVKARQRNTAVRLPQQQTQQPKSQAAETGSLKLTPAQKKMPSAYATLCSYVSSLAEEVGFVAEKEILRIPSTRNTCIVGRRRLPGSGDEDAGEKKQRVIQIIERELGRSVSTVADEWVARAEKLAKKPGSGH